jgi:small subunit ribosomal protein S20
MAQRSAIRTDIKKFIGFIKDSDGLEKAREAYRKAASSIDRGVRKSLVSKNRASRLKSRLNNRLRAIAG